MKGYAPQGALVEDRIEVEDFSLRPQLAPPEKRVDQHRGAYNDGNTWFTLNLNECEIFEKKENFHFVSYIHLCCCTCISLQYLYYYTLWILFH